MSSQAQIDANRRNAKKSTGPVSAEGKAACSRNALKSGIYASSHVIPGENPAELEALTAAYFHQYQPADPTQLALVDTLVATEWTQRRLRRIEAELWAFQIDSLDQNLTRAEFTDASFQHKSPLGCSYLNALEAFSRLQRRIESTNRMYLRTLKALQDLRKAPPGQAGQPAAPPEPSSPLVGEKPSSPLVGEKPSSPLVGEKQQPRPKAQPPVPPIGSVPSFTRPLAGRPHASNENHESSLTERPAPAEHTFSNAPSGSTCHLANYAAIEPRFDSDYTPAVDCAYIPVSIAEGIL